MSLYSLRDAARILRVSQARLRYWERTELVPAHSGEAERPHFDFRDLVRVRGVISLLDQGIPLRRIRRHLEAAREHLPELEDPVRSLRVWLEGSDRIVVRHEGVLLEPTGQTVLDFGDLDSREESTVAPLPGPPRDGRSLAEEAEACFAKGCELDVDPATFDRAVECYLQGIELEPDFADCHCNLGAVYYNRGERATARTLGLAAALVTRLALLCGIWLVMMLDEYHVVLLTEVGFPEAWLIDGETNTLNEEVNAVTPKDLLVLAGGLFLIWKSVHEIHKQIVHTSDGSTCTENVPSLFGTIVQIGIMDLIFSIDSVITAVGMANQLWVMITAV
ncbi:MAG: MerR family transcriptional regulator, partial [Myxococcota bacterium]